MVVFDGGFWWWFLWSGSFESWFDLVLLNCGFFNNTTWSYSVSLLSPWWLYYLSNWSINRIIFPTRIDGSIWDSKPRHFHDVDESNQWLPLPIAVLFNNYSTKFPHTNGTIPKYPRHQLSSLGSRTKTLRCYNQNGAFSQSCRLQNFAIEPESKIAKLSSMGHTSKLFPHKQL